MEVKIPVGQDPRVPRLMPIPDMEKVGPELGDRRERAWGGPPRGHMTAAPAPPRARPLPGRGGRRRGGFKGDLGRPAGWGAAGVVSPARSPAPLPRGEVGSDPGETRGARAATTFPRGPGTREGPRPPGPGGRNWISLRAGDSR